jgi:hypothetical protein
MSNILDKVEESSKFYHSNMLNIDYKLVQFCYHTLKPHFRGKIACELGPSTGYMTEYLLNDFEELDVIEGAKNLLDQIPEHKKLRKYHSLFEEFVPTRKYDTLIMNHVLEHIENPVELLKKLSSWIHEDGVFLIGVPNAKSFHRMAAVQMGLLTAESDLNERDKELGHYRVYDMPTLISHAENAGLRVIDSGGIFLKFLSNAQIEKVFTNEMLEAYYKLGQNFPHNASEIYIVCKNR